jgi:hypothetical protein
MDESYPYHHGPITAECPVSCLRSVLDRKTWIPLERGRSYLSEPPKTAGDVLDLYARDQFGDIWNPGKSRVAEMEVGLVLAGFDLAACRHSVHRRDLSRHGQQKGRRHEQAR